MSNKPIIVHGPQGCGKTRNGEKLRKAYGKAAVREFDDFLQLDQPEGKHLSPDTLYLTNMDPDQVLPMICRDCQFIEFEDAMRRVL